jgi:hypothetical protein
MLMTRRRYYQDLPAMALGVAPFINGPRAERDLDENADDWDDEDDEDEEDAERDDDDDFDDDDEIQSWARRARLRPPMTALV